MHPAWPWSTVAAPPENTAVSWLLLPVLTVVGKAVKEVMTAAGTTVTVTVWVAGPPRPVAVRV